MTARILDLDPATYEPHALHREERDWAETNCYVDVWIELLHALGHEPLAALPFTLEIDFEGDQWTFFKFPLADLYDLYGLDVQELNIWRSLVDHVTEQVARGRPVLVEVDSFFLPDTAGTSYQTEHVKTTVAIQEIDRKRRRLGYFHGQGYYRLGGAEFDAIFHLDGTADPAMLAPYVEFVKPERGVRGAAAEVRCRSRDLLRLRFGRRPTTNPIRTYRARFEQDVAWLRTEPLEVFHQYSFATLRQAGACFELLSTYLDWADEGGKQGLAEAAEAFRQISTTAKTLQFKLARAVGRGRDLDLEPSLDAMEAGWAGGMDLLASRLGS